MSTSPNRFWITALIVAWSFDLLFWKKAPGVSFAVFVLLCLGGGLFLAWRERVRMAPINLVLLGLILTFASLTFLRAEFDDPLPQHGDNCRVDGRAGVLVHRRNLVAL